MHEIAGLSLCNLGGTSLDRYESFIYLSDKMSMELKTGYKTLKMPLIINPRYYGAA